MVTDQPLVDDLLLPPTATRGSHPTDSSRILLGLMSLARRSETGQAGAGGEQTLGGVIDRGVLRSLLTALHYRDVATVRHSRRTAILAAGMAQHLGWEGRPLKLLEVAALLHDIGKIGVPDNVLFKPGRLNADEAELMALHNNIGVDVLQACRVEKEVLDIIAQAHQQSDALSDGVLRPVGEMHQGARILAVADAYDSLSTDQVYRDGKSHEEIVRILTASSGKQFDANIIAALDRWVQTEGNPLLRAASDALPGTSGQGAVHPDDAAEASSLCHIFSYLYVLESLYDGFYLVDSDLRFVVWNRGAEKLLGRTAGDMLGRSWSSRLLCHADRAGQPLRDDDYPLKQVIAGGKATTTTVRLQRSDGEWVEVETQSVPLLDQRGQLHGVAEIFRDVSRVGSRPREYRELRLAASRDPLTSVANRGELESQLAKLLTDFAQSGSVDPLAVIFLDVDHFKSINDTWGHTIGDQVLIGVARLLQQETYSGEVIGRYGGEEFVVLCPDTDLEQAVRRAERLRTALERAPFPGLEGRQVTASFGVAVAEAGDSTETLLHRADMALFDAKRAGRNRTCSLTSADQQRPSAPASGQQPPAAQPAEATTDPFVFTGTFEAVIAAEMVVYKLGGFVNDHRAQLKDVSPQRAVLRVGSRGLLPFWGASDDRRPVEIELVFGEPDASTARKAASRQVTVTVRIRPVGWVRDRDAFQLRAKRLMKSLRSYFVVG